MKYTTQDGFIWEVVSKQAATELLHCGAEVYKIYTDESESLIEMNVQLEDDDVMFYGIDENTARIFQKPWTYEQ